MFLVLLACKKGEGGSCGLNKDCKDNLVCTNEKLHCATIETANAECAASTNCKAAGWCQADVRYGAEEIVVCAPKSDSDCAQAACAKDGCKFDPSTKSCK